MYMFQIVYFISYALRKFCISSIFLLGLFVMRGANMRKQLYITILETVSIGIFAIIAFYFIYGAIHSYLGLGAVFPHLEVWIFGVALAAPVIFPNYTY